MQITLGICNLFDWRNISQFNIPGCDLIDLLTNSDDKFIFIKDALSVYQFANENFSQLLGLTHCHDIHSKTDDDFYQCKKQIETFKRQTEQVIETGQALEVSEEIGPFRHDKLTKLVIGKLYPIYTHYNNPSYILGITAPKLAPFKLNIKIAISLSIAEILELLQRRNYAVSIYDRRITLSKRELQCLIATIQGMHAGIIANKLGLRQTTIESYFENIKDKFGANDKHSMLETMFKEKVLDQIIL